MLLPDTRTEIMSISIIGLKGTGVRRFTGLLIQSMQYYMFKNKNSFRYNVKRNELETLQNLKSKMIHEKSIPEGDSTTRFDDIDITLGIGRGEISKFVTRLKINLLNKDLNEDFIKTDLTIYRLSSKDYSLKKLKTKRTHLLVLLLDSAVVAGENDNIGIKDYEMLIDYLINEIFKNETHRKKMAIFFTRAEFLDKKVKKRFIKDFDQREANKVGRSIIETKFNKLEEILNEARSTYNGNIDMFYSWVERDKNNNLKRTKENIVLNDFPLHIYINFINEMIKNTKKNNI